MPQPPTPTAVSDVTVGPDGPPAIHSYTDAEGNDFFPKILDDRGDPGPLALLVDGTIWV